MVGLGLCKVIVIKISSLVRSCVADSFLRSAGIQDRKISNIKVDREARNTSCRTPNWAIGVKNLPEIDGVAT